MAGKVVILLSGGLDSATTLALLRAQSYECYTLSVDYGQRHRSELQAAAQISRALCAKAHRVCQIDLSIFGHSALTNPHIDLSVPRTDAIPNTYVPARNTIFLSLALAWAEVLEADAIGIGVTAVDYSGYPDCRPAYVAAFQQMANLATKAAVEGRPLQLLTPLLSLSKADIIRTGLSLDLDYSLTVSCYQADATGQACGRCESCAIRRAGFESIAGIDPTRYQCA